MIALARNKLAVSILALSLLLSASAVAAPGHKARVANHRPLKALLLGAALFSALPVHPGSLTSVAEGSCKLPQTVATVLAEKFEPKHLPPLLRVPGRVLTGFTYGELMGPRARLDGNALHVDFSAKAVLETVTTIPDSWRVMLSVSPDEARPVVERFAADLGKLASGRAVNRSALQQTVNELTPMLDFKSLQGDASSAQLVDLLKGYAGVKDARRQLAQCIGRGATSLR